VFDNDIQIERKGILNKLKIFLLFTKCILKYDVFYFFWGQSFIHIGRFHNLDLFILKILGKKVYVHFRGTDVINIDYYKIYRSKDHELGLNHIPFQRPDQKYMVMKFLRYADKVFISTPDLGFTTERAILFPQSIDLSQFKKYQNKPRNFRSPFKIAHAPTRSFVKGTDALISSVQQLKYEGFEVEVLLIQNIPSNRVIEMMNSANLGFDQLYNGCYGKVSVEFMALGIPTLCYINDSYYPHQRPPIINVDSDTLYATLKSILLEEVNLMEYSRNGVDYVTKFHNVQTQVDTFILNN
jgi:hypothetical protein